MYVTGSFANEQTSSLLTFLTYTTIHEKEEYARVTEEMIRSGMISGPDDCDLSLDEEGDRIPEQDATTASKSVQNTPHGQTGQ